MSPTRDVKPSTLKSAARREKRPPWLNRLRGSVLLKVMAVILVLVLMIPKPAQAILPAVVALAATLTAFIAALNEILQVLREQIAAPLKFIQELQEKIWKRFDKDIWPIEKIGRAQGAAGALQAEMNRIKSDILDRVTTSARLSPVVEFERRARARTEDGTRGLERWYRDIFLPLPEANEAAQDLRQVIDFQDAAVISAFKEAAKIIEAADAEITAINRLEDAIKQAPPGTAPILEASASAARIKSEAFTQHALAELLRLTATQMAAQSLEEKRAAGGKNATLKLLQDMLNGLVPAARGGR